MAKILISYFSDYGEAMYDATTKILRENGNDIFRLNINNSKVYITKWGGVSKIVDGELLKQIEKFSADIVFNFNNSLPQNCYKILQPHCKICVLDADAPEVAFWNKEMVEKYYDKFLMLGLQSYSKTMYERYLDKKIPANKYLYFPPATIVQKENLVLDKNISFIGSNFYPEMIPEDEYFYSKNALKLHDEIEKNYFYPFAEAEKKYNCTNKMFEYIRWYNAGQERLKYLQQLTNLGLILYGVRNWNRVAYYDFELAKCFDNTKITTIEENAWVYNTSKISVNISHPLAKSSFSWRVMDIMASSSCLLMEDKPDWRDLFEKYLSKETLEAVIYKDRFDMREKAIKLLNDEELRLRCVADLNNAIEQNGRWENRFKELEKFTNIKLLNIDNKDNEVIFIQREEKSTVKIENNIKKRNLIQRLKIKNRFKIFVYALMIALAQIPILDLFQRKKRRNKLRQKMDKYWR